MHLVSWNVNGIRAILKKEFVESVKSIGADILCLQETKAAKEETLTALGLFSDYHIYANSSKARKGYSGTAILSKAKPLQVTYDIGIEEFDQEGRVITAEFPGFFLVTVYAPNSGEGLKRLAYRGRWDVAFRNYLKWLGRRKPVIACGDFNVAHQPIDLARPKENYNKTSGYTQQEIDGFSELLGAGFIDSFRHFHKDTVKYTYFSFIFNGREKNLGWRIDHFLVPPKLAPSMQEADVYQEYLGSDHCPVGLKINL